jgi:hypothetical protein
MRAVAYERFSTDVILLNESKETIAVALERYSPAITGHSES